MRRKVIQIADSTQLVSLPRKWAKKHEIKKGNELDVEEQGNKIIIQAGPIKPAFKQIELDFTNLAPLMKRALHGLYKIGYDTIILNYNNPKLIDKIQKNMRDETLGYEIVEQKPTSCVIKTVAGGFESEFDGMLRRTFLMLKSMFESIENAICNEDFSQVNSIIFLETANNKYTGFCRRIINKQGLPNNEISNIVYCAIEELEKIADECKYLCIYLAKQKNMKKIPKKVKKLYSELLKLYGDCYTLYYTFNLKKSLETFAKRKYLINKINTLFEAPNVKSKLAHHLLTITQKIANILSFELELYFLKKDSGQQKFYS